MEKTISTSNGDLFVRDEGSGPAVVLLHGFLESSEMWSATIEQLSANYRVIAPDLMGHGRSYSRGTSWSMRTLADAVFEILRHLEVDRFALIGHSMGGYVALALAEAQPKSVTGLCLFHSTAGADSHEKKDNRLRAIELVKQSRLLFIQQSIPNLFAPDNVARFRTEIDLLIEGASSMMPHGIIACLHGMRERPDRQHVLKALKCPVHWIVGKLDAAVPYPTVEPQLDVAPNASALVLEDVGHMGFIEAKEQTQQSIIDFMLRCYA